MNETPPFPMFHRGGFDVGPVYLHHGQGPHALAWATFALVLLLTLAFFALLIARTAAGRHHRWHHRMAFAGPGRPPDPLEFLRMRYARGEIDRDAFLQGTSDLTTSAPTEERPPG
ncbi:MAG TPA: hypothetical protein VKP14_10270 [Gaiellaceae bacterium]|nr:hypothetical protein [Gaiellaceae bacterium]